MKNSNQNKRRRWSRILEILRNAKDLKEQYITESLESGKSVDYIAKNLGVNRTALYRYIDTVKKFTK